MRSAFNTFTIALMPIAIVINIVIGQLVSVLNLPLYFDSIGTIMVGVLSGPIAGGVTGLLTHIIWGLLFDPAIIWFAPVAVVIGVLAGVIGARTWLRKLPHSIVAGLLSGLVALLIRAPIAAYHDITAGGTELLEATFQNFTSSLLSANLLQGTLFDSLDKIVSYLVVFLVFSRLRRRLLVRFPQGKYTARPRRVPLIGRVED